MRAVSGGQMCKVYLIRHFGCVLRCTSLETNCLCICLREHARNTQCASTAAVAGLESAIPAVGTVLRFAAPGLVACGFRGQIQFPALLPFTSSSKKVF